MTAPSRVDQLVALAVDSQFYPLSAVALKLALMLEDRSESLAALTELILSEVALTNQILRSVNSVAYRRDGSDGSVTTVSKALLLMGFDEVRRVALALELLRQRQVEVRNGPYEKACLQSMRAVALVRELVPRQHAERAMVTTMLRAAGTAACALVVPAELIELREKGIDQQVAQRLCRHWGLPEELGRSLSAPAQRAMQVSMGSDEYFRSISLYCHQLAGGWSAKTGLAAPAVAGWVGTLQSLTGSSLEETEAAVQRSMQEADVAFGAALGRPPLDDVPDRARGRPSAATVTATDAVLNELSALLDRQVVDDRPLTRNELLIGAISDIQTGLSGGVEPRALCRMLVESLHRAMNADLTVLYLVSRNLCLPFVGFGASPNHLKTLGFPLPDRPEDLVQAAVARGSDLLLHEIATEQADGFLPAWLRADQPTIQSLVVLPITQGSAVLSVVLSVSARASERASREELMSLRLIKSQLMQLMKAAISSSRK